jgi:hypothetical protein
VAQHFGVQVVDTQTQRGVPRVKLTAMGSEVFITDSAGWAAIPALGPYEGMETFFRVESDGYEYQKDGFGYPGLALLVVPGANKTLQIVRTQRAERLYRVTGVGVYRDAVLLGQPYPIEKPLLNAGVVGQDTVLSVLFAGQVHWFWGDTQKLAFPLGNFESTGAVSCAPTTTQAPNKCLSVDEGVDLKYFTLPRDPENPRATEFVRGMAILPPLPHPTWLGKLSVVATNGAAEEDGSAMLAYFMKAGPSMQTLRHGVVRWNSTTQNFTEIANWSMTSAMHNAPGGHAVTSSTAATRTTVKMGGEEWVLFAGRPWPELRCKATVQGVADLDRYEGWTPLQAGSTMRHPKVVRTAAGELDYQWRVGTPPADLTQLQKLGLVTAAEANASKILDTETGLELDVAGGSVHWHEGRQRWLAVFGALAVDPSKTTSQSLLGEIWFAEAEALPGEKGFTRGNATKIATHNASGYSCYNPTQHAMYSTHSRIFFSCTFVNSFSGNTVKEPLYDYNNIMFGLTLSQIKPTGRKVAAVPLKTSDLASPPAPPAPSAVEWAVQLGERQLFVDELGVASRAGVALTMHSPKKKGAVIRPTGFSDAGRAWGGPYNSVACQVSHGRGRGIIFEHVPMEVGM